MTREEAIQKANNILKGYSWEELYQLAFDYLVEDLENEDD